EILRLAGLVCAHLDDCAIGRVVDLEVAQIADHDLAAARALQRRLAGGLAPARALGVSETEPERSDGDGDDRKFAHALLRVAGIAIRVRADQGASSSAPTE